MPPPELNDQARLSVREASLAPLRDMCRIPGPKNSHMTTSVHDGNLADSRCHHRVTPTSRILA